jgi:hypothetical protein
MTDLPPEVTSQCVAEFDPTANSQEVSERDRRLGARKGQANPPYPNPAPQSREQAAKAVGASGKSDPLANPREGSDRRQSAQRVGYFAPKPNFAMHCGVSPGCQRRQGFCDLGITTAHLTLIAKRSRLS